MSQVTQGEDGFIPVQGSALEHFFKTLTGTPYVESLNWTYDEEKEEAEIRFDYDDVTLELTIRDGGTGFGPQAPEEDVFPFLKKEDVLEWISLELSTLYKRERDAYNTLRKTPK